MWIIHITIVRSRDIAIIRESYTSQKRGQHPSKYAIHKPYHILWSDLSLTVFHLFLICRESKMCSHNACIQISYRPSTLNIRGLILHRKSQVHFSSFNFPGDLHFPEVITARTFHCTSRDRHGNRQCRFSRNHVTQGQRVTR